MYKKPFSLHTPKLTHTQVVVATFFVSLLLWRSSSNSISGFPTKIFLVGINKNVEREKEMHKFAILGPFNSAQHTHIDTT